MNIELLQQLCEASAVSGDEQEVRDILINTLEPCVNEITFDGLGSFVARKGNKGPKVAVVGHMDEVGFMVTHIDDRLLVHAGILVGPLELVDLIGIDLALDLRSVGADPDLRG